MLQPQRVAYPLLKMLLVPWKRACLYFYFFRSCRESTWNVSKGAQLLKPIDTRVIALKSSSESVYQTCRHFSSIQKSGARLISVLFHHVFRFFPSRCPHYPLAYANGVRCLLKGMCFFPTLAKRFICNENLKASHRHRSLCCANSLSGKITFISTHFYERGCRCWRRPRTPSVAPSRHLTPITAFLEWKLPSS